MTGARTNLLMPGGKFGDYTVQRLLGAGGMGAVYLVRGDASGNEFAVKILDPAMEKNDPEFKQRFIFEAELAMAIRHENLINVYDMGRDPDTGYGYILMEYVPGGTVFDRLSKWGALSVEEAGDITCRVAKALAAIDAHHVVHRDVKPENIMFTADGVTPKLADLGVARLSSGGPRSAHLTQSGYILGSPTYMPAEQMENPHAADIRADIYALGVTFWQMLVGRPPYDGETALSVVAHVMGGEAIPDVRRFRPDVSAAVAELILRMTNPDLSARVQKPMQVAEALERIQREARDGALQHRGSPSRSSRRAQGRFFRSIWFGVAALAASLAICTLAVATLVHVLRAPAPVPAPVAPDALSVLPAGDESPAPPAPPAEASEPPKPVPAEPVPAEPAPAEPAPAKPEPAEPEPVPVQPVTPEPAPAKPAPPPEPSVRPVAPRSAAQFAEPIAPELRRYASYLRMATVRETRAEADQAILKAVNDARALDPDMRLYDLEGRPVLPERPVLKGPDLGVLRAGKIFLALELVRADCPKLMENYAREKQAATEKLDRVRPLTLDDVVHLLGRAAGKDLTPLFRELGVKADASKSTLR